MAIVSKGKNKTWLENATEEQKMARNRMALFPEKGEILFIGTDMWVVRMSSYITEPLSILQNSPWSASRRNSVSSLVFQVCSKKCLPG